jgi:hypothetical protein
MWLNIKFIKSINSIPNETLKEALINCNTNDRKNALKTESQDLTRAKVKTKHDRAELRMCVLQFTVDRGVSYSRQFRGKNLTKTRPKLNFLHLMKEILHRGHLHSPAKKTEH